MQKGLFITFEGADGSGKTTQLNKIKDLLTEKGFDVVVTREPGSLDIGKKIREILLHNEGFVSDRCEMFLFLADRSQHIDELIKPSINAGKIVLCDRHTDSTIAYQGYGREQDIELLKNLNKIAVDGIEPDLTLLFDVSTETAQERVGKNKDRMESIGFDFHSKVRNGYLELQNENPERIKIIDANNSIDIVFENTRKLVLDLIQERRGK